MCLVVPVPEVFIAQEDIPCLFNGEKMISPYQYVPILEIGLYKKLLDMRLIKADYEILHSNDRTMLVKLVVPYYKIMELQLMGRILRSNMLPVRNSNEGLSFILPEEYDGKANDLENIRNGSDFILAALQEIEGKYLSLIYADGVKIDRNDRAYILPVCTAYEVTIECKNKMFNKIIENI
ncbi:hypothetical protein [Intestinibacter sp.]|uniref:hypothetical protein n=1 Tax=Intestinibacter sp. TaxID=1965304 RepID=UPI003F1438DC